MSIVDELVENIVERNGIRVVGAITIQLVDGGLKISGALRSVLRDQRKSKDLLNVNIPVAATVKLSEVVIRLPSIP